MSDQPETLTEAQPTVLPWWQNPLNFIALGVAMLIFGVGIGYYAGH
ncbi:MAG: hypothetical protein F2860_04140, partial [Actinobacteria bacterium]|nr:hypothetical protein [Actinomycetota bacterium]MSZ36542.1 hypothetical protein [Actinomycetota bacterium]